MSRCRVLRRALVTGLAFAAVPAVPTSAQTYPSRNITLLVGFAAGGFADSVGRLVGRLGFDPVTGTQSQAQAMFKSEVEKWSTMVATLDLTVN
jgi:tripartite-type tricarboxylate transporter receptor subunit TctC